MPAPAGGAPRELPRRILRPENHQDQAGFPGLAAVPVRLPGVQDNCAAGSLTISYAGEGRPGRSCSGMDGPAPAPPSLLCPALFCSGLAASGLSGSALRCCAYALLCSVLLFWPAAALIHLVGETLCPCRPDDRLVQNARSRTARFGCRIVMAAACERSTEA